MGSCLSGAKSAPELDLSDENEKAKNVKKDLRKRNSQVFSLSDFIDARTKVNRFVDEGGVVVVPEDVEPGVDPGPSYAGVVCVNAAHQKAKQTDAVKMDPRNAKANIIADAVAHGNMRVLREQVIGHFSTINRPYHAQWEGDTLLHIACREGYARMVEFMFDPKNRSIFDTTSIVADVENAKWRTPLHLAFTNPSGTYCASRFGGLTLAGVPKAERPEDIVIDSDWVRPGTDKVSVILSEVAGCQSTN